MKATNHSETLKKDGTPKRVRLFTKEPPSSGSERRLVVLVPCPFCGDPMRINNAKLITHAGRPSACIIADLVWDEANAQSWNIRHNEKSPSVGEKGKANV